MSRRTLAAPASLLLVAFAAAACDGAPLAPDPAPGVAAAPAVALAAAATHMEIPVFDQITDVNPCTGETVMITYEGTGSVHGGNGTVVVQSRGDVTTSDGYIGAFDWTFVFVPEHVTHFRSHDMEVSDATGQRVVFAVGLNHTTWRDGEPVISFRHTTGARCAARGR